MTGRDKKTAIYQPERFDVGTIADAKKIILTPEDGFSPEERWELETPLLSRDISTALAPVDGMVLLDYGCGIGRLAKELLSLHDVSILGIDISLRMRALAHIYVDHSKFSCAARNGLQALIRNGFQADHGYLAWVLQHSIDPKVDIDLIWRALKPGGNLIVLNLYNRVVPTDKGWADDGLDVGSLLAERFEFAEDKPLTKGAVTDKAREFAFFRQYTK